MIRAYFYSLLFLLLISSPAFPFCRLLDENRNLLATIKEPDSHELWLSCTSHCEDYIKKNQAASIGEQLKNKVQDLVNGNTVKIQYYCQTKLNNKVILKPEPIVYEYKRSNSLK